MWCKWANQISTRKENKRQKTKTNKTNKRKRISLWGNILPCCFLFPSSFYSRPFFSLSLFVLFSLIFFSSSLLSDYFSFFRSFSFLVLSPLLSFLLSFLISLFLYCFFLVLIFSFLNFFSILFFWYLLYSSN